MGNVVVFLQCICKSKIISKYRLKKKKKEKKKTKWRLKRTQKKCRYFEPSRMVPISAMILSNETDIFVIAYILSKKYFLCK